MNNNNSPCPINLRSFVYKIDNKDKKDKNNSNNQQMRIHPPIELVMNEEEEEVYDKYGKPIIGPTGEPEKKKVLQSPPMLVFDHNTKSTRKLDSRDGMFYYMTEKPALGQTSGDYGKKRNIRFLITVTVYSETYDDLNLTLAGIYANLDQFKERQIGNEDIAVVVIFDGCDRFDESIQMMFNEEDKLKSIPKNRTMAHRITLFKNKDEFYPQNSIYMYQINLRPVSESINKNPNFLTVFFAVKLQNAGKLSSHLWFLRGFCELFNPYYIALIDCGTIPGKNSIYNMFQAMEGNDQLGGCCGYMGLSVDEMVDEKGNRIDQQLYDQYDGLSQFAMKFFCIQKAQKYEYSMSHILDKAFESLFGFIHVLPGAFSAYRWDALRNTTKEGTRETHSILDDEYLVSCLDPYFQQRNDYTIQKANMFLAEDRILCLEIFTKKNFIMKYIPESTCMTDPVKQFTMLMKQRRRWINGSWFALFYVLKMYPLKIKNSSHSNIRKLCFTLQMIYSYLNASNAYIIISTYFIFLWMTLKELLSQYSLPAISKSCSLDSLAIFSYLIAVFALFHYSLFYSQPEKKIYAFQLISSLIGLFMLIQFAFFIYICVFIFILQTNFDNLNISNTQIAIANQMRVLIMMTILFYAIPCILNFKKSIKDILWPLKDYIYYSPQYFHTLLIFAFCNINDLSWGTKGKDKADYHGDSLEQKFLEYKIQFVGKWVLTNILIASIGGIIIDNLQVRNFMILALGYYFVINLGLRSVCSIIEFLKYYLFDVIIWKTKINNRIPEYKRQSKELKEFIRIHLYGKMYQNSIDQDITEFANKINHRKNELLLQLPSHTSSNKETLVIQNNSINNSADIFQNQVSNDKQCNIVDKIESNNNQIIIEFNQDEEKDSDFTSQQESNNNNEIEDNNSKQINLMVQPSDFSRQTSNQKNNNIHDEITALLNQNINNKVSRNTSKANKK